MIELRELESDDRQWLVRYLNNEQLVRYLASRIPQPYSFEDADWWVEVGSKESAFVRAISFHGAFCGVIGVYTKEAEYAHAAELGYWVAQEYWNQGIASKAVTAFTELVFSTTDIQRIYALVSAPNLASIQVLQKAGYSLEGILKQAVYKQGQFYDEHLFAKIRSEQSKK
ncbi:MAG: GNAT family N-acetyltransferase [Gammaproteobacteria bacterium]|nr:GNAT family N-acetyltransferase [Gammaproteobacteria bacterium]